MTKQEDLAKEVEDKYLQTALALDAGAWLVGGDTSTPTPTPTPTPISTPRLSPTQIRYPLRKHIDGGPRDRLGFTTRRSGLVFPNLDTISEENFNEAAEAGSHKYRIALQNALRDLEDAKKFYKQQRQLLINAGLINESQSLEDYISAVEALIKDKGKDYDDYIALFNLAKYKETPKGKRVEAYERLTKKANDVIGGVLIVKKAVNMVATSALGK
jgi:hypothetical protein